MKKILLMATGIAAYLISLGLISLMIISMASGLHDTITQVPAFHFQPK
jgi:hypothetical protein